MIDFTGFIILKEWNLNTFQAYTIRFQLQDPLEVDELLLQKDRIDRNVQT
jgi:hypothetical protein